MSGCKERLRTPWIALTAVATIAIGCSDQRPTQTASPAGKQATEANGKHDHDHDADDHDPHEMPHSLAEVVGRVKAVAASLEKAFADGAEDRADELVHEAGHLLEHAEGLLAKAPEAVAAAAREGWGELSKCLEAVDEKLHGDDEEKAAAGKAYDSVKDRLKAALESLEKAHAAGGKDA
jgi:hypothetical protein